MPSLSAKLTLALFEIKVCRLDVEIKNQEVIFKVQVVLEDGCCQSRFVCKCTCTSIVTWEICIGSVG